MTVPTNIGDFVRLFAARQKDYWNDMKALVPARRGDDSAVMSYYRRIDGISGPMTTAFAAPAAKGQVPPPGDVVGFVTEVERRLKAPGGTGTAKDSAQQKAAQAGASPGARIAYFVAQVAAAPEFSGNAEVQAIAVRIGESEDPAQAFDVTRTATAEALVERSIIGPRLTSPTAHRTAIAPAVWDGIASGLRTFFATHPARGTTLLYCYWLDEAGVQWAVERAAFRAENGDDSVTGKWPVFNLSRDATLVGVLAGYITAWQRGDLAALQERQQMYFALYGYPLYIAARGRPMRTPDPRHGFPSAFNNFLSAAMKYYEQERNLNFDPNIAATRAAFDQLMLSLKEGDQNMRDFRPPEIRAQFEYLKDVLGDEPSAGLNIAWQQVLQARPGLQEVNERWTSNCDAIAEANRWRRPHARNYRTLAENGEVILVTARAFDAAFPSQTEALIQVLRDAIQNYVEAFNAVCGVALERESSAKPPALLMAKRYPPPQDAPWPRYWEPGHAVPA